MSEHVLGEVDVENYGPYCGEGPSCCQPEIHYTATCSCGYKFDESNDGDVEWEFKYTHLVEVAK